MHAAGRASLCCSRSAALSTWDWRRLAAPPCHCVHLASTSPQEEEQADNPTLPSYPPDNNNQSPYRLHPALPLAPRPRRRIPARSASSDKYHITPSQTLLRACSSSPANSGATTFSWFVRDRQSDTYKRTLHSHHHHHHRRPLSPSCSRRRRETSPSSSDPPPSHSISIPPPVQQLPAKRSLTRSLASSSHVVRSGMR